MTATNPTARLRADILAGLRASETTSVGDMTAEQLLDAYDGASLAEFDRLRAELADARARALNEGADAIEAMQNDRDDMVNAALGGLPDSVVAEHKTARRAARLMRRMAAGPGREETHVVAPTAPRTERSRWVAIADALNAALDAGMPVGIDLDGTLTDHNAWSVVWDRDAERWTVAGYEDDEAEAGEGRG